jgi:site-specific recombinase XerD
MFLASDRVRALKPATAENYATVLERHLVSRFGAAPLLDLTEAALERWIAEKKSPGGSRRKPGQALALSSIKVNVATVHVFTNWALEEGHVTTDPFTKRLMRTLRAGWDDPEPNIQPFTPGELRRLVAAAL